VTPTLKAVVRWSNGVAVRSGDTKLLFDPIESDPVAPDLFISHAHFDHSKGFRFPIQKKRSTKETKELYEVDSGHDVGNWEPIRVGRRLQVGGVEVEAHDAGHVLGSVQYEIISRDENIVYASHLNFADTLISRAAEVAPCDVLILEASFPATSQTLPPRESVIAAIVKWALECIGERRVPTLAAERIGVAQELVRVFNTWTELTVVVHPKIARINEVYSNNGIGLRYVDAGTEEAQTLIGEGKCVVIIPRRFDVTQYGDFRVAYVTDRPTQTERVSGNLFVLSEEADLEQLLLFVKECRATTVFTFRGGGSKVLAEFLSKRLGVVGRTLSADVERPKPITPILDEEKLAGCEEYVLGLIQIPNFTYEKQELVTRALNEGFKLQIVEEALSRLVKKNSLSYSQMTDGYSLP
jgi:putative mRNA 3-end processing factor